MKCNKIGGGKKKGRKGKNNEGKKVKENKKNT